MDRYKNRTDAGKVLAEKCHAYAERKDVLVLALPRGGVPVAYEIAEALHVPLDVFIVRKLGVPGQEELAMGAMAMGGAIVFNDDIVRDLAIPKAAIDHVIKAEEAELKRRELRYRGDKPLPELKDKIIILVDDGIATGATMQAAVKSLEHFKPSSIIIAVPVAEKSMCTKIAKLVDKLVCPLKPLEFHTVGEWYETFDQTSDDEVIKLLKTGGGV